MQSASTLPSLTPDGKVNAFQTADGRLLVLFKTSVGWKGNDSGFVYADGGLRPSDLASDYYGRTTARMGLPEAAAPVLGRRVTDRCYPAFFDLR